MIVTLLNLNYCINQYAPQFFCLRHRPLLNQLPHYCLLPEMFNRLQTTKTNCKYSHEVSTLTNHNVPLFQFISMLFRRWRDTNIANHRNEINRIIACFPTAIKEPRTWDHFKTHINNSLTFNTMSVCLCFMNGRLGRRLKPAGNLTAARS